MATARASSDNVSIKIRCNSTHVHARDAVRRFAIPKQLFTYEKLIEMIHGYYPHTKKSMFKLQYRDGEGDNITVTCTEELLESLKLATQKNDILRLTIVDNIREANFDRHWRKSNDGFSAFIAITLAVLIFGSSVMAFKRLISGTGKESAYDYACPHSKLIGTYTAPDTLSKPLLINHTDQHGQSYVSDKLWILDWKGEALPVQVHKTPKGRHYFKVGDSMTDTLHYTRWSGERWVATISDKGKIRHSFPQSGGRESFVRSSFEFTAPDTGHRWSSKVTNKISELQDTSAHLPEKSSLISSFIVIMMIAIIICGLIVSLLVSIGAQTFQL